MSKIMSKTKIKMVFDPLVAKQLGTDTAIILSNIEYWVQINESNNRNFKDGQYWTYNSVEAFNRLFDYLTKSKIRTCLQKLVDNGYIIKGNYNQSNYDKTTWYTINNSICQNSQMEVIELTNGIDEINKPIPDNKLQIKNPDNNTRQKNSLENLLTSEHTIKYGQDMITEFKTYWNSPNGKLTNFDKQKIFDIEKRLATWFRNANNIDNLVLHNRLIADADKKKAFLMLYPNQDFEKAVKLFYVDCKVGREGTSYKDYVNHFFNKIK